MPVSNSCKDKQVAGRDKHWFLNSKTGWAERRQKDLLQPFLRKSLLRQPEKGSIFPHASENLATALGVRQSACRGLGGKKENMPNACSRALQQKCLLRRVVAALVACSKDGLSGPSERLLSSPPPAWAGKGTRSAEVVNSLSTLAQALQSSSRTLLQNAHVEQRGSMGPALGRSSQGSLVAQGEPGC